MRAIWTGSISFGLVNVPVKLYGATESHDIAFHQVHDEDGGRVRNRRVCEKCGEPVDYGDIDKAYDDGERTVVMDDEDFESLPAAVKDEIEVVQFVPAGQVDPIMLEKAYFLEPVGKSPKSYLLLRQTLEDAELTAIVRFSLREKTRLGVLRTRGKVMVLQGLLWSDEVREVDFPAVGSRAKVAGAELEMSAALVAQFAGDFDPAQFHDDYQEQLRQLIDAKLEQGDAVATADTFGDAHDHDDESGGEVLDLMEALKRSLEQGRAGGRANRKTAAPAKRKSNDAATSSTRETEKDKTADKKTATKKTAPKKAPTKKASPKDSAKKDEQTATSKKTPAATSTSGRRSAAS